MERPNTLECVFTNMTVSLVYSLLDGEHKVSGISAQQRKHVKKRRKKQTKKTGYVQFCLVLWWHDCNTPEIPSQLNSWLGNTKGQRTEEYRTNRLSCLPSANNTLRRNSNQSFRFSISLSLPPSLPPPRVSGLIFYACRRPHGNN